MDMLNVRDSFFDSSVEFLSLYADFFWVENWYWEKIFLISSE